MKDLGEVVLIKSNSWNITNGTHLNSINRKRDTLCGTNFSFPESDTEPITREGDELFKGGNAFNKTGLCPRCLAIYLKSTK